MRSKAFLVLPLALMAVVLSSVSLFASQKAYYMPDQVIVQVQLNVNLTAADGRVTTNNAALQAVLDDIKAIKCDELFPFDQKGTRFSRTYAISLAEGAEVVQAVSKLLKTEAIKSVQPNYVYQSCAIPTDASYSDQWGTRLIQTAAAWDMFTGNNRVMVAVLDTGVDWGHQDLADNIWVNVDEIPDNNIDDDGNGYVDDVRGWDFTSYLYGRGFIDPDDEEEVITRYFWKPEDNNPGIDATAPFGLDPHGTHVAGIVGAVGNNAVNGDVNVVGVLWNCRLMALQAGVSGGLQSTWIAKGLRYAADNGAQVINMSFGGDGGEAGIVVEALKHAHSKGVVLCAAAGNENTIMPSFPASLDNVISVAATDENDQRSIWPEYGPDSASNYGPTVDISAPGTGILSTLISNTYGEMDGTSMACPFVSGAAGLVIGYGEAMGKKFTPAQVEYILEQGADNIDAENPNYVGLLGTGRLNVNNSLIIAQSVPSMISSIWIQPADDPSADDVVVDEHSARDFQAIAVYSDGTTKDVTDQVMWTIRPLRYGSFSDVVPGRFSALQVPADREVVISATLSEGESVFSDERVITIADDPDASPLAITGLDQIDPLSSGAYKAIFQTPEGRNIDVTSEVAWEIIDGTEYANFDMAQAGVLLTKSSAAGQKLTIKSTYIDQTDRRIYTQTKEIQVSNTVRQVAGLYLTAPGELAAGSSVQLSAQLIYAGQALATDVTAASTWSVSPEGAGSFTDPGLFLAGNVTSATTATLTVQYTTNGQVYTAQLQTRIIPAQAKTADGIIVEPKDNDENTGDNAKDDGILSGLPCSLPGLLVLAGLTFGGLLLMRED